MTDFTKAATIAALLLGMAATSITVHAQEQETAPPFDVWLSELQAEALSKGFNADVVTRALAGVTPIKRIIELDRRQPEFTLTFSK